MKDKFVNLYSFLKGVLFDDKINRYLFLLSICAGAIVWFVWHRFLSVPDLYIYVRFSVYPVQLLFFLLVINSLLAIFSYTKEREISYLLFTGNVFVLALVFSLEIFYLLQMKVS